MLRLAGFLALQLDRGCVLDVMDARDGRFGASTEVRWSQVGGDAIAFSDER